jgi:hypothetical protein
MHCRKPTGSVNGQLAVPERQVVSPSAPVCPNCGQMDATQKASGIIAAGMSKSHHVFSSPLASSSTDLARKLSKPSDEEWNEAARKQSLLLSTKTEDKHELSAGITFWQSLILQRRRNLFYCVRCGGVFNLDERQFAPLEHMSSLLFQPLKNPIGHEICEIQVGNDSSGWKAQFLLFIVPALGPQGIYITKVIKWKEKWSHKPPPEPRYKDSAGLPNYQCHNCMQAHIRLSKN